MFNHGQVPLSAIVTVASAEAPVESTTVITTGVFAATHRVPLLPVVTLTLDPTTAARNKAMSELNTLIDPVAP